MARLIVVGAGVTGLSAASSIAALGHDVLLVEAGATIGGTLGTLAKDGWGFDTAQATCTWPQAAQLLFVRCGQELTNHVDFTRVREPRRYVMPDGTVLSPVADGVEASVASVAAQLGSAAGSEWEWILARGREAFEAAHGKDGTSPTSWRKPQASRGHTLMSYVKRKVKHDVLAMAVRDHVAQWGCDPRRAPVSALATLYAEQAFGVWRPSAGMASVVAALGELAASVGAVIHTGSTVSAIVTDKGQVTGVELSDGRSAAADGVVWAADPLALMSENMLEGGARRKAKNAMDLEQPRGATFSVFVAPRMEPPAGSLLPSVDGAQLISVGPDLADQDNAVFATGVYREAPAPASDPTLRVTATRAHTSFHGLGYTVTAPVPMHVASEIAAQLHVPGVNYNVENAAGVPAWSRYAHTLLGTLHARGLLDPSMVEWTEVITPADVEETTLSPGGASSWRHTSGRAPELVKGLYVPEPSVGVYGGFTSAVLSGMRIADHL